MTSKQLGRPRAMEPAIVFGTSTRNMTPDTITTKTIGLVRQLIVALQEQEVGFVHWKSNININAALGGLDDLDLLVRRSDLGHCCSTLAQMGFRQAEDPPSMRVPGIHHFFAYDADARRVVHVHLHAQLVVGNDLTKNYHLPLAEAMIDSATPEHEIPLPSAELELIVYALRMVLKFTFSPNPFTPIDRAGVHREFEDLESRSDDAQLRRMLHEHLPWLDSELYDAARRCLRPGTSNWFRFRVRGRLHAALKAHARHGRLADAWLKFYRRLHGVVRRRLLGRSNAKRLISGGAIIAIVGGDGAGKTTLIETVSRHFAKAFDTEVMHLGKPTRSLTTRALDVLLKIDRILPRLLRLDRSQFEPSQAQSVYLLRALRCVALARDRFLRYTNARRGATAGRLVISDRWPLDCLKLMDGPQIQDPSPSTFARRWVVWLQEKEAAPYRRIASPELLLVLLVHPDLAVARKTTESESSVRPRSQEVYQVDWETQGATVIDASGTADEVAERAIALIWQAL